MRRNDSIAAPWLQRLEAAGLSRTADLLERAPDQLRLAGDCQALTKPGLGRRQRWRWSFTDLDSHPAIIYLKRYGRPGWKAQCDRILRQNPWHSRGWWEYQQAQRLTAGHLPAPSAVGVAEQMLGPIECRSTVLLGNVPGDAFDRAWAAAIRQDSPITRGLARHDITLRLARFIAAFHEGGLCHRDLYLCHVFVDLDLEGRRPPRLTLIDLARAFRPRIRRKRWIIKDLAQLDSSARQIGAGRTDRLRFLQAYLGLQSRSQRVRWYARRVVRKSDWILRRIERKSRRP